MADETRAPEFVPLEKHMLQAAPDHLVGDQAMHRANELASRKCDGCGREGIATHQHTPTGHIFCEACVARREDDPELYISGLGRRMHLSEARRQAEETGEPTIAATVAAYDADHPAPKRKARD
jgi:hypothetical protein